MKTNTTIALLGVAVLAVSMGMTPAFAQINGTNSELVQWVTGEQIPRVTIDGQCGENTNHDIVITFFEDYVHVASVINGQTELQRYFDYNEYSVVLDDLIVEVYRC